MYDTYAETLNPGETFSLTLVVSLTDYPSVAEARYPFEVVVSQCSANYTLTLPAASPFWDWNVGVYVANATSDQFLMHFTEA